MARTRRTFTAECKADAVRMVTEQGYSFSEAAGRLGISENSPRRWKQIPEEKGGDAFPGRGRRSPAEEELARLREKNKRPREERDILKKATAFNA